MTCTMPLNVLTFYKKSRGQPDGIGGFKTQWSEIGSVRSDVQFKGVRDRITGELLQSAQEATAMIPSSVPVTENDRVDVDGVQFTCLGTDPNNGFSHQKTKLYIRKLEHERTDG